MGRTPDPAGLQTAKGNPGRRKSAVARRLEESERVAALLGAPAEGGDPLAVPMMIQGKHAAAAVAVWRDLAPRLAKTHRLQAQHRPMFAAFCVYFAEWVIANEDVSAKGHTQRVKTTVGGTMERIRPIVAVRDRALERVLELSKRFGLTPADEYSLFKDQAVAAATNPGLFGAMPQQQQASAPSPAPADPTPLIGRMNALDSAPPGTLPN